jgi:Predicted Zn-dependent peptidases
MKLSRLNKRSLVLNGASVWVLALTLGLSSPSWAQVEATADTNITSDVIDASSVSPPQAGAAIVPPPLQFTHRQLANGLNVYAMPDATAGTVTVQMWYDVGGKDDPEGRSGFAHLFEHILSRKTVNIPYGYISTLVENAGGTRNASTNQDYTNYYETVPPEYLETMLWTHAERMARPVIDQAVFDAERSIVKEELRQRVLATPYGRFNRFVIEDNQFDQSIYRRSVIGSIEQLDAATIDDARAFHEAYYRPSTATLIVSGNFDTRQLDRLVDQYFAGIQNPVRPVPVLERPTSPPRTRPRRVDAYAPNVPTPALAAIYPGAPASDPDQPALDVLAAIMSRGNSSRLYQALVYQGRVASRADFSRDAQEEGGSVIIQVVAGRNDSLASVETALNAQIARIRDEPVTEAELAEAKTQILTSALNSRETPADRAFTLGRALAYEHDPYAPDRRLAEVQRVTAADVQRVARRFLDDRARVTARYMDESERPQGVAEDSWRNPAPMPTFLSVPPAILPPNSLRPEGQRQAPPAPGVSRPMPAPRIAERTLANGLRVVVAQSTDLPIVNVRLVVPGGTASDPADQAGLASMTGLLLEQGAAGRTAPEIAEALEALGANIGGGAGADASGLSLTAPIATADAAGRIFTDVITRPDFDEGEVSRRRARMRNSLRVDLGQPGPLASYVLNRIAYGAAPYGAPSEGTPGSIADLTREDVIDYYRTWWRPEGSTLVVTGGLQPDQAFAYAERLLGGWRGQPGQRPVLGDRAGPVPASRMVVVDLPGADQAAVVAAVRGPRRGDPGFYPLAVVNAIIGGGQSGHLFQEIRAQRGLSYGARSALSTRLDGGLLAASTQTKNESAAEVVALVLQEFDRLRSETVSDQRITERESYVNGSYARSVETTSGLGNVLAASVSQNLPLSEVAQYPGRISATTPASLRAAAMTVSADRAYVVVVGQADQFIDALRRDHPDLILVRAQDLDLDAPDLGL